jgi:ankyrin repeat protein
MKLVSLVCSFSLALGCLSGAYSNAQARCVNPKGLAYTHEVIKRALKKKKKHTLDKRSHDNLISGGAVYEIAKYFVKKGIDLNSALDKEGTTLLMVSAFIADKPSAEYLLEHGADINAEDCSGHNARWHALSTENLKFCRFLVKKGAETSKLKKISKKWLNGKVS